MILEVEEMFFKTTVAYQVDISREPDNRSRGSWGNVMFSAKMFRDNIEGTVDFFRTHIYPRPALQPEYPWLDTNSSSITIPAPKIKVASGRLYIRFDKSSKSSLINQIAIYKLKDNKWSLLEVLPVKATVTHKEIGPKIEKGNYVATLIDRFGREGKKTYFEI